MNVLFIALRELRATFHSAIGWLVLCGFVLITGVFWVAMVNNYVMQANNLVFNPYGGSPINLSDYLILPFFGNCTIVVLMVAPALSMRLFSEEFKQRTMDLLLTSPITTAEIVLGKYLGVLGFFAILLLCTLHFPASLFYWADPEPGAIIGGYLGLVAFAAAILALGMFFSALTDNQIIALVLTFSASLALYLGSWMGGDPDSVITQLSLATHLEDVLQGLLRLSDVVYFAGFIGFFVFATHQGIESLRWGSADVGPARDWSWLAALAGVVLLLGAGAAYFVTGQSTTAVRGLALSGCLLIALWGGYSRKRLGLLAQTRIFAYSWGAILLLALAFGTAASSYVLARGHDKTFDLTRDKSFTLSDQSVQILAAVTEPVEILAFFRGDGAEGQLFRQLVSQFTERSSLVSARFVDPLANPLEARKYEVENAQGLVIVRAGEAERRLETDFTEESLARAILLVRTQKEHQVCWATGHGETDPDDESTSNGHGNLVLALDGLNYAVQRLLVLSRGVPQACDVVIIARPLEDWPGFARDALATYIAQGGRALIMLDPGLTPLLADELARYGVLVGDDVVLDGNVENQLYGVADPSAVVLSGRNLQPHPINRSLSAVVLKVARSVSAQAATEGLFVQELLRTSEIAWAETNFDEPPSPNPAEDRIGEIPVMAIVEVIDPTVLDAAPQLPEGSPEGAEAPAFTPVAGGRLVVIGDSDFATNDLFVWGNNRDLFLNSVAWLVDEEDQIGSRPKKGDTLDITAMGEAVLCLVSIFFVPGLAMAAAVVSLLRRRFL